MTDPHSGVPEFRENARQNSENAHPMEATLAAFRAGRLLWYGDVIALERPPE